MQNQQKVSLEKRNPEEEAIRRSAYLKGMQLMNTGLDAEGIYARLEKQGFDPKLATEVAVDVFFQRSFDNTHTSPADVNWIIQFLKTWKLWRKNKK